MLKFIRDIKKYKAYIFYAARAQLKSEVSNAYLDWLWWILEPLGYMFIYVILFQGIFKSTAEYFPIFIYTGNTIWGFFSKVLFGSVDMIRSRQSIISRVYVPKFIFILSDVLVNAFKMLVNMGIIIIMMICFRVEITWHIFQIIPTIVVLYIFTLGLSMICMHIGVFVKDMSYVANIGLNMWMFMSGVFYSMESFEEPAKSMLTYGNPLAFIITSFRDSLLYAKELNYLFIIAWFIISMLLLFIGVRLIYKNENSYVKVI